MNLCYLHVRVDGSSLLNCADNGRKVIISQNHVRCLLGDFGSVDSHGNSDVGLLQSGSIIDSVSSHSDNLFLQKRLNSKDKN